jgi:hypothetical protein
MCALSGAGRKQQRKVLQIVLLCWHGMLHIVLLRWVLNAGLFVYYTELYTFGRTCIASRYMSILACSLVRISPLGAVRRCLAISCKVTQTAGASHV